MSGPLFVYLYKANASDGEELRYSLRSLEQNFFVNGNIVPVVVGDKPSWYEGRHIEVAQDTGDKYRNILKNVLTACHELWDENRFYYMDDDYFLMDPTDHILMTHGGNLADHAAKVINFHGGDHEYAGHMIATRDYLGPDAWSFEQHRPLIVVPRIAHAVLTSMWSRIDPLPFWRTVYGNAVKDRGIYIPMFARDGRLGSTPTPGVPWLSTSDAQWRGKYGRMIREMFPIPSRWEPRIPVTIESTDTTKETE